MLLGSELDDQVKSFVRKSTFLPPLQSRSLDTHGIRARNSQNQTMPPSSCTLNNVNINTNKLAI